MNYGYASYLDFQNRDVTLTGILATWQAGANGSNDNIEILFHRKIGWTYAATGFIPGNGAIAERLVDQALAPNFVLGKDGKWKRTEVNQFVDSSESEGIVIRVTASSNNAFQVLNISLDALSEELTE